MKRELEAVRRHANDVEKKLDHISKNGRCIDDVIQAFKPVPVRYRNDVFWKLDNDWTRLGHAMLRQCRNHPVHGPQLFKMLRGEA